MNTDIGNRIKSIREAKKLEVKDVADIIGIQPNSLNKIERDGSNNVKTLQLIADALNVSIAEFFDQSRVVSEGAEKFGSMTRVDFEEIKRLLESVHNKIDQRLPPKSDEKSYKAKISKSAKKNK